MDFYQPVITKPCKRCGQPFETRSSMARYCDLCRPVVRRAATARSNERRKEKRRVARAEKQP